jgi:hypothetical protein
MEKKLSLFFDLRVGTATPKLKQIIVVATPIHSVLSFGGGNYFNKGINLCLFTLKPLMAQSQ